MKLVEQSVELVRQQPGWEGLLKHIEKCGRVCYKSEDRITEGSAEKFVKMIVGNKHLSVLEHGYVVIDNDHETNVNVPFVREQNGDTAVTNLRYLLERVVDNYDSAKEFFEGTRQVLDRKKNARVTFHVTTSRATIDEMHRHRTLSASVESTRFCNYGKDKFDNEITFVIPSWANDNAEAFTFMKESFEQAEYTYLQLVKCWDERKPDKRYRTGYKGNPLTPQQARQILPMGIKSEAYLTAFVDDWIDLLLKRIIPAAHPDAVALSIMIRDSLIKEGYCSYDDFTTLKL